MRDSPPVCVSCCCCSMAGERWNFTRRQLLDTPSRKHGIDGDKELSYRQQAANFIQDMGQRLQVTQLCINTAIVYMHRFYMFHSFTKFHRNNLAAAALFLAAKVEEQPRKLEHVIKVSHMCLHRDTAPLDTKSEAYLEQAQILVINENTLLQTLGFDLSIDHPHTHVVKTCQLVRASKDLAQTSYFLATNSLHLTTMCLQYKPTVVSCVCIHLATKWSNWEIPKSSEGKHWYWYVDKSVTSALLEELTQDFLTILDKCPSRLKRKIMSYKTGERLEAEMNMLSQKPPRSAPSATVTSASAQKQNSPSKEQRKDGKERENIFAKMQHMKDEQSSSPSPVKQGPSAPRPSQTQSQPQKEKPTATATSEAATAGGSGDTKPEKPVSITSYKEYKERKERERLAALQEMQAKPDTSLSEAKARASLLESKSAVSAPSQHKDPKHIGGKQPSHSHREKEKNPADKDREREKREKYYADKEKARQAEKERHAKEKHEREKIPVLKIKTEPEKAEKVEEKERVSLKIKIKKPAEPLEPGEIEDDEEEKEEVGYKTKHEPGIRLEASHREKYLGEVSKRSHESKSRSEHHREKHRDRHREHKHSHKHRTDGSSSKHERKREHSSSRESSHVVPNSHNTVDQSRLLEFSVHDEQRFNEIKKQAGKPKSKDIKGTDVTYKREHSPTNPLKIRITTSRGSPSEGPPSKIRRGDSSKSSPRSSTPKVGSLKITVPKPPQDPSQLDITGALLSDTDYETNGRGASNQASTPGTNVPKDLAELNKSLEQLINLQKTNIDKQLKKRSSPMTGNFSSPEMQVPPLPPLPESIPTEPPPPPPPT